MAGRAGQSGGWNRKSIAQHKLDGTYRPSLHAKREELEKLPDLCQKPKVERKKPGAPKKWIRNASDRAAIANGCWFEQKLGAYAVEWIEKHLVLTEGEHSGKPFVLMPWQKDLLMRLFSWVRWDDERKQVVRRFTRCYVHVPKKNGKTPLSAAVSLYMLCGDSTAKGCNVFVSAVDKIQASLAGRHVFRMIGESELLSDRISVNETMMRAVYGEKDSILRTVPGDAGRVEGLNGVCCVMDELHAWKDDRVFNSLRFLGAGRPEPLHFAITTAGDNLESVCRRQYDYAKAVEKGQVKDDGFLSAIYEANPDDNWTSPATWRKANPSLGHILHLNEMKAACTEAKQSPKMESVFKRYRLNLWTTSESPWLDMDAWAACFEAFDETDVFGFPCHGGLDLAKTRDTTALALMFHDAEADIFRQLVWFWMPEETARKREHLASFKQWASEGILRLTPGDVCDYGIVFDDIAQLAGKFKIQTIAFDPYNAEQLTQRIEAELGIERYSFAQTIRNIHPAASEYERRIIAGTLRHNGNGLLTWQAQNTQVKSDNNGNTRPVKRHVADYRTIDGVMAGVMALGQSIAAPKPKPKMDFYETHQVELI